jgi:hypothetical protein
VHCRFFSTERKCTSSSNTTLLGPPPSKQNGRHGESPKPGPPFKKIQEAAVQSEVKDSGRRWLWAFLAVIVLAQFYVVRELLAAFAIFALGFAVLAAVLASIYMLQKAGELAVARLAALRHPVINMAKATNMASVASMASVGRENRKAA